MPGEDLHLSVMAPLQAHLAWPACRPAETRTREIRDSKPNYRRNRLESRISRALVPRAARQRERAPSRDG